MQWVETTGKSLEEAKDAALDQLGVDEQEAEFEVLEEPRPGLFGRKRGQARVRARVAPRAPRPKQERRDRRRSSGKSGGDRPSGGGGGRSRRSGGGGSKSGGRGSGKGKDGGGSRNGDGQDGGTVEQEAPAGAVTTTAEQGDAADAPEAAASGRERSGGRSRKQRRGSSTPSSQEGTTTMSEPVPVSTQADLMSEFLEGLVGAFGYTATVTRHEVDEDTIELDVEGDDLGLFIGPKGSTLDAIQDLARTVAQRRADGPHEGRVRVDVAGYRQRRREALARFTRQVAEQVRESGEAKALEPMNPADRKVVHDTVNELDGVVTSSAGHEPRRWVVISPS